VTTIPLEGRDYAGDAKHKVCTALCGAQVASAAPRQRVPVQVAPLGVLTVAYVKYASQAAWIGSAVRQCV
jgi:hypothetical protein